MHLQAEALKVKFFMKKQTEIGLTSKEMKIGIAYDGVLHQTQKGRKIRKELDNKVAYIRMSVKKQSYKNLIDIIRKTKKLLQATVTEEYLFHQRASQVKFFMQILAVWRAMYLLLSATE